MNHGGPDEQPVLFVPNAANPWTVADEGFDGWAGFLERGRSRKVVAGQKPKSLPLAYVFLFLFGGLGIHHFYLGRNAPASIELGLFLVSITMMFLVGLVPSGVVFAGFVLWLVVLVLLFIDIVAMPAAVRSVNRRIARR